MLQEIKRAAPSERTSSLRNSSGTMWGGSSYLARLHTYQSGIDKSLQKHKANNRQIDGTPRHLWYR